MNLVKRLIANDTFIEGIHKEDLKQILHQSHPSVRVSVMRHGTIILSNGKIIKCIHRYYLNQEGRSTNGKCFDCQKTYNVQSPLYSCLACHLECLQKLNNREIIVK